VKKVSIPSAPIVEPSRPELAVIPFGLDQLIQRVEDELAPGVADWLFSTLEKARKSVATSLLSAQNAEELHAVLLRLYPDFSLTYLLVNLSLKQIAQEKPSLFSLAVRQAAASLMEKFSEVGPRRIGDEATNHIILGLNAVSLVNRAAARRTYQGVSELPLDQVGQLIAWMSANRMTMTAVAAFLESDSENPRARANAQTLAAWAYQYGILAYHSAKEIGLVKVPTVEGELPSKDEQFVDQALEKAALEDFRSWLGEQTHGEPSE
jgi:hypothetical protein